MQTDQCHTYTDEIDAYFDDELEGDLKAQVEQHIQDCDACLSRLSDLESLIGTIKRAPQPELQRDLSDIIIQKIAQSHANTVAPVISIDTKRRPQPQNRLVALSLVAASIAAIGCLAYFTMPVPSDRASTDNLVALYDDDLNDDPTTYGISTNEDGLYAIKL